MIINYLGIIPARSGSKSIKDKNIAKVNDKPLIAWSISTAKKCKYIDDKVIGFKQDKDGFIKHLKLNDGTKVKGDLFIDCTGFARLLINKVEDNKWVSYEDNLLVDSALNFNYKIKHPLYLCKSFHPSDLHSHQYGCINDFYAHIVYYCI